MGSGGDRLVGVGDGLVGVGAGLVGVGRVVVDAGLVLRILRPGRAPGSLAEPIAPTLAHGSSIGRVIHAARARPTSQPAGSRAAVAHPAPSMAKDQADHADGDEGH